MKDIFREYRWALWLALLVIAVVHLMLVFGW